jgi:hypothetical protein
VFLVAQLSEIHRFPAMLGPGNLPRREPDARIATVFPTPLTPRHPGIRCIPPRRIYRALERQAPWCDETTAASHCACGAGTGAGVGLGDALVVGATAQFKHAAQTGTFQCGSSTRLDLVSRRAQHVRDGTRLGRYEIHSVLGRGGMGEVWRARDTKLNRDIAIKMLPEPFARNAQRLARLEREAQWPASSNVLLITPDEGRVVVEGGVRIDEWSSLTTG